MTAPLHPLQPSVLLERSSERARARRCRRGGAAILLSLGLAVHVTEARAEVSVPAPVQAELVAKVAGYDRSFAARAGRRALVLVVQKADLPESVQFAQQFAAALQDLGKVGGIPSRVEVLRFGDVAGLVASCIGRSPSLLILSAGFERDEAGIAQALAGFNVLSFGASGADVERGAVVGFDLEGGKPKIVVNLGTARAQGVVLSAQLLKLARIVGS